MQEVLRDMRGSVGDAAPLTFDMGTVLVSEVNGMGVQLK